MRPSRGQERGLTLIEVLIVLAIISAITAAVIAGSKQLPSAKLRRSATMLTAGIKVGYMRATSTSRSVRLVMDFSTQTCWLEESDQPMLAKSKDTTGTGGADAVTQAEKEAVAEGERLLKVPVPKPSFHAIESLGFGDMESGKGGKPLQDGIVFREIQTAHDDEPRKEGRAYLYFWPGGLTERASIQLAIAPSRKDGAFEDSDTLSLVIAPLTGQVTIKSGPQPCPKQPADDLEASEREDRGI